MFTTVNEQICQTHIKRNVNNIVIAWYTFLTQRSVYIYNIYIQYGLIMSDGRDDLVCMCILIHDHSVKADVVG